MIFMRGKFKIRNRHVFILDLIFIFIGLVVSYLLRLDYTIFVIDYIPTLRWMVVIALLVKPAVYFYFGLYRRFWMYASTREMIIILKAVFTSSILYYLALRIAIFFGVFLRLPRSIPFIDFIVSLLLVGGVRLIPRLMAEAKPLDLRDVGVKRVLIIGAGDAGALVVRELQKSPQLKLAPIGFLDDDSSKLHQIIHEIPVIGNISDLDMFIKRELVDEVVIAIPSVHGKVVRQVIEVCQRNQIQSRTMPGLYELLGGSVSVNRLRKVEISDLLRRRQTNLDKIDVGANITGKRVLVTGAGGSIASELCRQICRWNPAELILLGHGENSIFEIAVELEQSYPNIYTRPIIADIRTVERIKAIFNLYKPQMVFHAAAHKHVSLMEKNIVEAITNNIMGTCNLVKIAHQTKVERFVMISTDKAVQPTSVMGATKRIAEMIVMAHEDVSDTKFSVVRFGNVLGSRGSVVPIFQKQIEAGGPITVTHPDVERYFMTIPEAVHLVLQAFSLGNGGEIFMLDMGEPVRIMDLAEDLIRLSGLVPNEDIAIAITGLKSGEKMTELLWGPKVQQEPTKHPEITKLNEPQLMNLEQLDKVIENLMNLAQKDEFDQILKILDEVIPGANIAGTPPPEQISVV
jgi:FlaA1/EpsC-like NDP-sugar epimerase